MKYIIALVVVLVACSTANQISDGTWLGSFDNRSLYGKRVNIDGVDCVIVSHYQGVAMSCNWNGK